MSEGKIYLRTKDVIDVYGSENLDPQHSYLIAEFDNKQYILRAGPSGENPFGDGGNPLIGNLYFTGASDLVEYSPTNSKSTHHDWDYEGNHNSFEIFAGNNEEVKNLFSKLRFEALKINEKNYDYRWNNQNCNTALNYVIKQSQLNVNFNNLYDKSNQKLWMIGSEGNLKDIYNPNLNNSLNSLFEFIDNFEFENLNIDLNNRITIEKSTFINIFSDSGAIASDAIFIDENLNVISKNKAIFSISNPNNSKNYSFIRSEALVLEKSGNVLHLDSLINNFKEKINIIHDYVENSVNDIVNEFKSLENIDSILLDINSGIAQKQNITKIAENISTKISVKNFVEKAQNQILFNTEDYNKILNGEFDKLSLEGKKTLNFIQNNNSYKIGYNVVVSILTEMAIKGDLNSQDYGNITLNAFSQSLASLAVEKSMEKLINDPNSLLKSQVSSGLGYGISHIISSAIKDFYADDKMNSHQWMSTLSTAGVVGASATLGSVIASALYAGSFAGPIGSAVAVIVAYALMGGKKLEGGEYFEKIASYSSEINANNLDYDFYVRNYQGAIIKTNNNSNDNLYGNIGSDGLVGNFLNNSIYGNGGNDQLIGNEGDDILNGGEGSDWLNGGVGNDYLVGGLGGDIIYGGFGDDIIFDFEPNNKSQIIENDEDLINAGFGDDVIYCKEGDDIIFGGSGNDQIKAGDGKDLIFGGEGKNLIAGDNGDNIQGNSGADEIFGGRGDDLIDGGGDDDYLDGGSGVDLIFGGSGNDIIFAGESLFKNRVFDYQNSIHGEIGNDFLIGSNDNDLISDGAGDDTIYGKKGDDKIILGEGNNLVIFNIGDGNDQIILSEFSDKNLVKNQQNSINIINNQDLEINSQDILLTKIDNDLEIKVLSNNASQDKILIKNQFLDQENFQNIIFKNIILNDNILINLDKIKILNDGKIEYLSTNDFNQQIIDNVDNLKNYDEQYNIVKDLQNLNFYGINSFTEKNLNNLGQLEQVNFEILNEIQWLPLKKQRNILGGNYVAWRDYLVPNLEITSDKTLLIGNFWSENFIGNDDSNQINAGDGFDYIDGKNGNDILYGGGQDDRIFGGDENDLILGGAGNDYIDGGYGDDEIYGNDGDDIIFDLSGKNAIFSNSGNDEIHISANSNLIFAGLGDDKIITADFQINGAKIGNLIYGEDGNDYIESSSGSDQIYGGKGSDLILGKSGADYISGGAGNDVLHGDDGDDKIFGDQNNDFIYGGNGNDLIWGGDGEDVIYGDGGNDLIKGGSGADVIYSGVGDNIIFGEDGADIIYLDSGSNLVNAGLSGDIIFGGAGNDEIFAGDGDDLIYDSAGNDRLYGGVGRDIFIIENMKNQDGAVDYILDFDKFNDSLIIKTKFDDRINFAELMYNSRILENNLEINLGNNKKIILNNIKASDLNSENFKIGFALNENDKIIFAEDSGNLIFGNDLDNIIYGSKFNDEIFAGNGMDSLYGLEGNDIFHYEIDNKFLKNEDKIYSDEIGYYVGLMSLFSKMLFGQILYSNYFKYSPSNQFVDLKNTLNNSTFVSGYDLINSGKIAQYNIAINNSRVQNEPLPSSDYYYLDSVEKIDFKYTQIYHYKAKNFYNNQNIDITGYNQSLDFFNGDEGNDMILMTNGNDYISFDDNNIAVNQTKNQSRINSIETIMAFDGDDIINFSSPNYQLGNILIRAGGGNDKIFSNSGNDLVFGEDGDDEIFAGNGDDIVVAGFGANQINAGEGNDIINSIFGEDIIDANDGNDTIIAGAKNIKIDAGSGIDLIDLSNFKNGIFLDLSNNLANSANYKIEINNIENIEATIYDDIIYGNNLANIIKAGLGNDKICGGGGDDTYIFENNHGFDEIFEEGIGNNIIQYQNNFDLEDLKLSNQNNDLIISNSNDNLNKISVKNYFNNPKIIQYLKLNNENFIDISSGVVIKNEDEEVLFDENFYQKYFNFNPREVVFSGYRGSFMINSTNSQLIYKPKENYFGFDEINFTLPNLDSGKIIIFFNPLNDAPNGNIQNFTFYVNQEININFNDYFNDPEGGKLNYELALNSYRQLPDWLNFNQDNGILATKIFRSGNLNFDLKIYDNLGFILEKNFKIDVLRNANLEVKNIANKNEIKGDLHKNILIAISGLSDFIDGDAGDDEIFFIEDEKWNNLLTDDSQINFSAWNIYSGDRFEVKNKIRSFDCFDGGEGYDILKLTEGDDALFLDDQSLSVFGSMPKFNNIEEIHAEFGDDVIDMTSFNLNYGNIKIYGGVGDDILWSNNGDDQIFGEFGNDNIQGGAGNDYLDGGSGNDVIKGYDGDDVCYGNYGSDIIYGAKGSDLFLYQDILESTIDNSDIIKDFDVRFDKFWFKNLKFNSLKKIINLSQDNSLQNSNLDQVEYSENQLIANDSNILYFEIDQNNNTRVYDKNSNFSIILEGVNELTNYHIL
ncbi:MAG: hypothetical protein ACO26G_01275 [Rickettsiales bacterium]